MSINWVEFQMYTIGFNSHCNSWLSNRPRQIILPGHHGPSSLCGDSYYNCPGTSAIGCRQPADPIAFWRGTAATFAQLVLSRPLMVLIVDWWSGFLEVPPKEPRPALDFFKLANPRNALMNCSITELHACRFEVRYYCCIQQVVSWSSWKCLGARFCSTQGWAHTC